MCSTKGSCAPCKRNKLKQKQSSRSNPKTKQSIVYMLKKKK